MLFQEMYKHEASNGDAASGPISNGGGTTEKPKKKVIYFADGSTMEDYDDDDDDNNQGNNATDSVEGTIRSAQAHTSESAPPVDPVS